MFMRKIFLTYLTFILIITGGREFLYALPSQNIKVVLSASKSALTIGDSLTVACDVEIPSGVSISEPANTNENPLLFFDSKSKTEQSLPGRWGKKKYTVTGFLFFPQIHSLQGRFRSIMCQHRALRVSVLSNPIVFIVKGVITAQDTLPKGNRLPVKIPLKGLPIWVIIVFCCYCSGINCSFLLSYA